MHRTVAPTNRSLLIHYHIFKNAGSTIDFVLQKNFANKFGRLHGNEFNSSLDASDLLCFLTDRPELQAVSSHHLHPPKPISDMITFYDILILRHPIDRLLSAYDFYRRSSPLNDPVQAAAKNNSFQRFLECLIVHFPHLINNAQVNYLGCGGNKIPREPDLRRALRAIPQFSVVGTVEQLDTVLLTAEVSLSGVFGPLDCSYMSQNVSPDRAPELDQRLRRARELSGSGLYDRLLKLNRMDLELLEAANQESRKRFEVIPDHSARANDFRSRCRALT